MATKEFKRVPFKFNCKGVHTSSPVDLVPQDHYLTLQNVRTTQDGAIRSRYGFTTLGTIGAGTTIHSMRVLNDNVAGVAQNKTVVVGAGTSLFTTTSNGDTMTSRATGLSGQRIAMVPARPPQSPEPWMYTSEGKKVNVTGTVYNMGVAPPNVAASAALGVPVRKVIQDFDTTGDWAQGGTAGAPSSAAANRTDTTIAAILYDTGTTGWALIKPTVADSNLQPGERVTLAATETVVVENVFHSITTATISSLTYDSGTSGLATIQLAAPAPTGILPNMLLYNATRTEYIRVQSVTRGPDGSVSFRASTVATFVAADSIQGVDSFRAYLTTTRAATHIIKATYIRTNVTVGTGYLDAAHSNLDLSVTSPRPIDPEDEIHISVRFSDIDVLTEGRILFDVDTTTNDFTRNYFYFPFRANDLTPAVSGTITSLTATQIIASRRRMVTNGSFQRQRQQALDTKVGLQGRPGQDFPLFGDPSQSDLIDFPTLPPSQTTTGDAQWTELKFKVKDLIRVGSDSGRTLKNVATVRVQVQVTSTVDVDWDSWWIGGTYGPDAIDFPINYRYCYYASSIGARSNPAPEMRAPVEPHREQVILTLTASTDTQVDKIEVYRVGGTLLDWTYVGVAANSSPTFTDNYIDADIVANPLLEFNNFVPFPQQDTPKSGTCSVTGTKVIRTAGDTFYVGWLPGTVIIIDGIAYTLYSSPTSTTQLEIVENAGTKAGVSFLIQEPTYTSNVSTIFGPYGGGSIGLFLFGIGSAQQSGTLFWTKGNNPDSAPDINQLEISSPSEPLTAGCVYDGRAWVFTSERMHLISPNFGGSSDFISQEVPNSKGAISRLGIAVGPHIYFVAKDGIYETDGQSAPKCISDPFLYNLFMHEAGQNAVVSGDLYGIDPINFTAYDQISLTYYNGFLYFSYQNGSSVQRTLVYDTKRESWFYDSGTKEIECYTAQEGLGLPTGSFGLLAGDHSGNLLILGAVVKDDVSSFTSKVLTGFQNMGDPRGQKLFRDILLDADRGVGTLTVKVYLDNNTTTSTQTFTISSGTGRVSTILDLNSGAGYLARSIALEVSWTDAVVKLYEWHPSYLDKAETIESRFIDWTDAGIPGDKRVMGFLLDADTFNSAKSIQLQYDGGTVAQTYSIIHNGQRRVAYALTTPFIAKLLRLSPTDEIPWYLEGLDWITEAYPENLRLVSDFTDDGDIRVKWLQGFDLEADTSGTDVSLQLQGDGGAVIETFTANHNGRIVIPYSLTNPYITHTMRIVPSGAIRLFNIKWYWRPEAEKVTIWESQPSSLGLPGFFFFRDAYIAHLSTANLTLTVTVDGVPYTYTVAHSSGLYTKTYVPLHQMKGKQAAFRLTSTAPFRLYGEDSEVRVKAWAARQTYNTVPAFGNEHPIGARQAPGAEI